MDQRIYQCHLEGQWCILKDMLFGFRKRCFKLGSKF